MRKPASVPAAASTAPLCAPSRDRRSVELVCLALGLALFALASRIAAIW
jgi:hypothetical protein